MAAVSPTSQPDTPRIAGDGVPESAWRRSAWLAALPALPAQAWLTGTSRVVVVSPHPDDEALGCGGLIATARAMGLPVHVVSVTDGEACYPDSPVWPAERLRTVRRRELDCALAILGVEIDAIDTLDIGDGRVAERETELAHALAPLLHTGDRVLTTWRGDGHPDHEATARAVECAAARRGAEVVQFPVWAWHWLSPGAAQTPLPGAQRLVLTPAACRAKAAALGCFVSQLHDDRPGTPDPILPPHVLERFDRDFEVVLA
ncbi:putative N-acetylglucosaminylphosphatidylinositol deacetylase [Luteimonas sp. 9C]|uniref:PIG-L deacetylase family protein n=1 Tax=Luteimonas sp. 9C TaxID=2653148 RepID=UPI0012F10577|nr:PIG-L family deacetylase [Luteimonas sp. 9C]VXB15554.1 putative N-acetylglucosaminylphosphatidylinositol deacetylase [Luteimonas sp. 9C]